MNDQDIIALMAVYICLNHKQIEPITAKEAVTMAREIYNLAGDDGEDDPILDGHSLGV